jgi:hypothetical protein
MVDSSASTLDATDTGNQFSASIRRPISGNLLTTLWCVNVSSSEARSGSGGDNDGPLAVILYPLHKTNPYRPA